LHRGSEALSDRAAAATRLPSGHPEGFIEAFANVYRGVARAVAGDDGEFPTVQDGARGVHFIHAALTSARAGAWVDAGYSPPEGTVAPEETRAGSRHGTRAGSQHG
jgi:hypothetical protein